MPINDELRRLVDRFGVQQDMVTWLESVGVTAPEDVSVMAATEDMVTSQILQVAENIKVHSATADKVSIQELRRTAEGVAKFKEVLLGEITGHFDSYRRVRAYFWSTIPTKAPPQNDSQFCRLCDARQAQHNCEHCRRRACHECIRFCTQCWSTVCRECPCECRRDPWHLAAARAMLASTFSPQCSSSVFQRSPACVMRVAWISFWPSPKATIAPIGSTQDWAAQHMAVTSYR